MVMIRGHEPCGIAKLSPTKPKKIGAKSPNVTTEMELRILVNWDSPISFVVTRIPP